MKRLRIFLVVLLGCFSFSATIADSGSQNSSSDTPTKQHSKITLLHLKRASNRPNAPSRVGIECAYGDGFVEFFLPESISGLSVIIHDDSDEWHGFVTRDESILEIPTALTGEYSVECTADDGKVYSGYLIYN